MQTTQNELAAKATAALQANTTRNEIQKAVTTRKELLEILTAMREQIKSALPKHITPERIIRVALTAVSRNPKLLECAKETVLGAIVQASQLGLEPDGVLGQAYLVPFWNGKNKRFECQFIPGYRGYIDLARRSDKVKSLMAQVVCEGDDFEYEYGLNEKLRHVPGLDNRGEITHAYAYAQFTNGGYAFVVLTKSDIDRARAKSQAKDNGPWMTDYEAMAQKTAVRRLSKWLPLSVEFAKTVELDEKAANGLAQSLDITKVDTSTGEIVVPVEEKTESAIELAAETKVAAPTQQGDPAEETRRAAMKVLGEKLAACKTPDERKSVVKQIEIAVDNGVISEADASLLLTQEKGAQR